MQRSKVITEIRDSGNYLLLVADIIGTVWAAAASFQLHRGQTELSAGNSVEAQMSHPLS